MSATPDWANQVYKDTNNGNLWRANSTTPGDWTLELQNIQVRWTPTALKLGELIGFFSYNGDPGITKLTFLGATSLDGFDIETFIDLTEITFPNLVSVDPLLTNSGYLAVLWMNNATTVSMPSLVFVPRITINWNAAMVTFDISSLAAVGTSFQLENNASIVSFSAPSLVTVGDYFNCKGNTSLTTVSLPLYLPTNGKDQDFSANALNLASVNMVLGRCVANAVYVSGTVDISGGTNAAPPTGAGTDHDILIARGVTVTHN